MPCWQTRRAFRREGEGGKGRFFDTRFPSLSDSPTVAIASRLKNHTMNTPANRPNPLLIENHDPVADPDAIRRAHLVLVRDRYRDIRDLRRKQTATEAVAGLDLDGREIFGLTKGQFSLIDLIEAVLDRTGPAALSISTWTAANTDVSTALALVASGRVTAARWLVDLTFVRRCPQLAARRLHRSPRPRTRRLPGSHARRPVADPTPRPGRRRPHGTHPVVARSWLNSPTW